MGMLQRKYGLTCDNLSSAEVITAAGELLTAERDQHPELLWALRGGGGNFGVVTSFEFQAHPVGPIVLAGWSATRSTSAPEVAGFLRDFIADAPPELCADAALHARPAPAGRPRRDHGSPIIGIFLPTAATIRGGLRSGRTAARLRIAGGRLDPTHAVPVLQRMLDAMNPHGNLHYWTGEYLSSLDDQAIKTMSSSVRLFWPRTLVS